MVRDACYAPAELLPDSTLTVPHTLFLHCCASLNLICLVFCCVPSLRAKTIFFTRKERESKFYPEFLEHKKWETKLSAFYPPPHVNSMLGMFARQILKEDCSKEGKRRFSPDAERKERGRKKSAPRTIDLGS